jgi:hypothetical protein
MAAPIRIKRSAVPGKVPGLADVELSELAINTYDGRLYTRQDDGTAKIVGLGHDIKNAQVAANAAIEGTKIDPDFGSQDVKTTGSIAEVEGGEPQPVVILSDVGVEADQVPVSGQLGRLAFLDELPSLVPNENAPFDEKEINFEFVSNTEIKVRMRGTDGVLRSATLTLA